MSVRPFQSQVFRLIASLVEDAVGLHYATHDEEIAWDKMVVRATDAGFESLLDYYYALRYDDAEGVELRALVDALAVNETYLFREWDQLLALVDGIVVPAVRAGRRMRVWSAACSTGEEPFGLAMLLTDRGVLSSVEIVATDVSERALARARAGLLAPRSLRTIPDERFLDRFVDRSGARPRVAPQIRAAVRFDRTNLYRADEIAPLGTFDVILCRNVLIYFSDAGIARVVGHLVAAMRPQGFLFVGVSESLLRLGLALTCEERGGVFVYRSVT